MNFQKIRDTLLLLGLYEDMKEFQEKLDSAIAFIAIASEHSSILEKTSETGSQNQKELSNINISLRYALIELNEINKELEAYNGIRQD